MKLNKNVLKRKMMKYSKAQVLGQINKPKKRVLLRIGKMFSKIGYQAAYLLWKFSYLRQRILYTQELE